MADSAETKSRHKRNEEMLDEICRRVGAVEVSIEKLTATLPIMERLEKAENKLLEADMKRLSDKVVAYHSDFVDFRKSVQAKSWFFTAAVATALIGAFFSLILN